MRAGARSASPAHGLLGVKRVEVLALLAEGLRVLARRPVAGARAAATGGVTAAWSTRALAARAVVHERGVRLVLGAVEVHVRADAVVVALRVLHQRGDGIQERVGDALKLAQAPVGGPVLGLGVKAALAPQVIRR